MDNNDSDGISNIPLSGKFMKTLIGTFCAKPIKGDDTWPHMSIGVAENSVVATDSLSAIIIGEDAELHVSTQRKSAELESARAAIYGDAVRLEEIERKVDKETGEAEPMPHVRAAIRTNLMGMKPIAVVDPAALLAIGKLAAAANAWRVELFQPSGDPSMLGFEFQFHPDEEHINLFSTWEGEIQAKGIFKATAASRRRLEEVEQAEQPDAVAEPPKRKAKKSDAVAAETGEELPPATPTEPEPDLAPIDLLARSSRGDYLLPPLSVLAAPTQDADGDESDYREQVLEIMRAHNVPARILAVSAGPTVARYEIEVPAGAAIKRVAGMGDDIQLQLGVKSVRIQAPIPGKKAIGIELPNPSPRTVALSEVCARHEFVDAKAPLTVALGLDIGGRPVYADLAQMPHLLIAGATNSGKSIGVAALLCSLLLRNSPDELRLLMIDPKRVELTLFEDLPHLMCPVVTEIMEVPGVLRALVREMERRYDELSEAKVRNISGYNAKAAEKMPYCVLVVDELADLIMTCSDAEDLIVRLAQKARAVGIHLVVATQRPSADIVTGLIKANIPSRIAYNVASGVDSRVILDQGGAEKLLGRGDMLFSAVDAGGQVTRIQGAYVSEAEVDAVCDLWRTQPTPDRAILQLDDDDDSEDVDDMLELASAFVRERGQASTSMLQRKFSIGLQRAAGLLDEMERQGIVGPRDGPGPRKVLEAVR